MRKFLLLVWLFLILIAKAPVYAAVSAPATDIAPIPCNSGSCPTDLLDVYKQKGDVCVASYDEFKKDPARNHFWSEDPDITAQGKADERARQFIYWALNKNAIDDHPILKTVWNTTRNISYFFVILIAAILGIGLIIGQRINFDLKIKIWPSIMKVAAALLYVTFSAAIVIFLIQLSELIMKFFIENLGGQNLFNVYFGSISKENNYLNFVGCRDLNFRVQESVGSELFLLKLTNITYYVMGIMLILRKIILWFLLFVSPFLAILFPFVLIRNIGWIWIGVFFQWLFYGPLFALFLGALSTIWKNGIPYTFDFSRVNGISGYIYPTATNILYGGPAQHLTALNSGNYIDTFAEYVITLIMLWAVIFFPWWLLRIFRDYCCDSIMAIKNVLLSMYDQWRSGGAPQPPTGPLQSLLTGTALRMPQKVEIPIKVKVETVAEIKRTQTEDLVRSMDIHAAKLADVARFETDKTAHEKTSRNINYLQNPMKAETSTQRQKFMNIRNELLNRAIKDDRLAKQVLSSISSSKIEQAQTRENIIKNIPAAATTSQVVSVKVNLPQDKVASIIKSLSEVFTKESTIAAEVAQRTQAPVESIQKIFTSISQHINENPIKIVDKTAIETNISKEKVVQIVNEAYSLIGQKKDILATVAQQKGVRFEELEKIVEEQKQVLTTSQQNIEKTVVVPPTISIEDYEAVKKMWQQHYEKGEVPVSENIQSRDQWLNHDIVFITNVLNKLLSESEEIRRDGLDDLEYILPIFMINNFKGDEILVYLKAKLEAAKLVQEERQKEKEITQKLKEKEEFVEIPKAKEKEKEKTLEMSQEISEEKKAA